MAESTDCAADSDYDNVMAARAYEESLKDYVKNIVDQTDPFRDMKMRYAQDITIISQAQIRLNQLSNTVQ